MMYLFVRQHSKEPARRSRRYRSLASLMRNMASIPSPLAKVQMQALWLGSGRL